MNLEELQNLDPQNFGNWPIPVKAIIILLVCILAIGAGFWFISQPQMEALDQLKKQELTLKDQYRSKQRQANSLKQLREQLEQIQEIFSELLKRLPKKAEVPDLLREISQLAQANNLDIKLFQPERERTGKEFYKELPITMELTGSYKALGAFVSDVSKIPRIVTQHDISLSDANDNPGILIMKSTAKTYRLDDNAKKR